MKNEFKKIAFLVIATLLFLYLAVFLNICKLTVWSIVCYCLAGGCVLLLLIMIITKIYRNKKDENGKI